MHLIRDRIHTSCHGQSMEKKLIYIYIFFFNQPCVSKWMCVLKNAKDFCKNVFYNLQNLYLNEEKKGNMSRC